jgi:transposase-like protein
MSEKRTDRRDQWSQRIAQQEASGESIREFCSQRGLSENAFYAWRQRLRKQAPVKFALVDTKAPAAPLQVILRSGERLQIPADEATLRMVFRVLAERP